MKEVIELTDRLADEILKIENSRKEVAKFLRKIVSERISLDEEILDEKLIIPISKAELDGIKIAGVDGGLAKKSLHGIDLRLSRAVGVIFSFSNGKLESVDYHPSPLPPPIPNIIFDSYSELELELSCGMERQILEVSVAEEVIEKFKPEILLMHGSIIPHYTERPSQSSPVFPTYLRMIEGYKKLLQSSTKNSTLLAGVVEDSRGVRFCEILSKRIFQKFEVERGIEILLERGRDTTLLNYALKAGERTLAFSYSSQPATHPILREFGELANSFSSFYLKTVEFDRPIRIDVFSKDVRVIDKLSSVLLTLAGHSSYGLPSILIEADQRARLSEKDLELFYRDLATRVGNVPGILSLRRDERPF